MEKKIFSILVMLILGSCQQEEISIKNEDDKNLAAFSEAWLNSKLTSNLNRLEGKPTCYMFSKEELNILLNNCQLRKIRFIPGLKNGKLDLKVQGINAYGSGLGIVSSVQASDAKMDNQIIDLSSSVKRFRSNDELINSHLLNPRDAFSYINRWNIQFSANQDLNDVVSYDNVRINYFSIQKEIIAVIAAFPEFKNLGVFFKINFRV